MRVIIVITTLFITLASCKSKREIIRPTYQVSKDVSYGKEDMSQTADIYWRNITTNTQQSVVILMHGGGWYTGDKANFDDLNVINIFIEYGFVVVNMNYRLAPAYKYPAPLDDIDSVIAMITAKSKLYNANTNQIFLLGKSAGGHIALQYAYSRKNECVKAVVDFFGLNLL
jgi:acetyl esterase/lipase